MNIQEFINNMMSIEQDLLQYLDHSENHEENYQNVILSFANQNIQENSHNLRFILHLITKIANNHYRCPNFFDKIEKILLNFQDIKRTFTNHEIFNIFKSNKKILLFLLKEKTITLDQYIVSILTNNKYEQSQYIDYFYPELEQYFNEKEIDIPFELQDIPDNFEELRKIGQNEDFICQLIQKDAIDEFITYVNKNNFPLNSTIKPSIYETNNFLTEKQQERFCYWDTYRKNYINNNFTFCAKNHILNQHFDLLSLFVRKIQMMKFFMISIQFYPKKIQLLNYLNDKKSLLQH